MEGTDGGLDSLQSSRQFGCEGGQETAEWTAGEIACSAGADNCGGTCTTEGNASRSPIYWYNLPSEGDQVMENALLDAGDEWTMGHNRP